jgi:hypothetical protein
MTKRVIVKVTGGIGNQLFQYCFGRALSLRDDRRLVIDQSSYGTPKERALGRRFALDQLNHVAAPPTPSDRLRIRLLNMRIVGRLAAMAMPGYVSEERGDTDAPRDPDCLYVTGYWQTWRHIEAHRELLLRELRFRDSTEDEPLHDMIRRAGRGAVMMHVRRGDYLTDAAQQVLGLDYYQRGLTYLRANADDDNLTVFVFTDDPEWAEANARFLGFKTVIAAHHRTREERDLQMMALCHHHVIANSTYSWWASYLRQNPGLCVAPRDWQTQANDPAIDNILPPHWIRL